MWKTAHMFGFVMDDHDFIQACRGVFPGESRDSA